MQQPPGVATLIDKADSLARTRQAWEHAFVTAQPHPSVRFQRALDKRSVLLAEATAHELGSLNLGQAFELVVLYAEAKDPKYERAALRYLERMLTETSPTLEDVVATAALLVERRGVAQ